MRGVRRVVAPRGSLRAAAARVYPRGVSPPESAGSGRNSPASGNQRLGGCVSGDMEKHTGASAGGAALAAVDPLVDFEAYVRAIGGLKRVTGP